MPRPSLRAPFVEVAPAEWVLAGICVVAAAWIAACSPFARSPEVDAVGPQRAPLPRAELLLDRTIERVEREAGYGQDADTSRLAHLRMTRAAVDRIKAGEDQRAFDLLERAIALDGSAGFGYLYLGYVHLRHGDADQAAVFLDRAIVLLPRDEMLQAEVAQLRKEAMDQMVGPPRP